jgi:hypothetical protein
MRQQRLQFPLFPGRVHVDHYHVVVIEYPTDKFTFMAAIA